MRGRDVDVIQAGRAARGRAQGEGGERQDIGHEIFADRLASAMAGGQSEQAAAGLPGHLLTPSSLAATLAMVWAPRSGHSICRQDKRGWPVHGIPAPGDSKVARTLGGACMDLLALCESISLSRVSPTDRHSSHLE